MILPPQEFEHLSRFGLGIPVERPERSQRTAITMTTTNTVPWSDHDDGEYARE